MVHDADQPTLLPAAQAFEKKYGIHVDYVRTDAETSLLRVLDEARAGKVQADVIDGTLTAPALKKEGLIMKWVPDISGRLPKQYVDPAGLLGGDQFLCPDSWFQYRSREDRAASRRPTRTCSTRNGRARWLWSSRAGSILRRTGLRRHRARRHGRRQRHGVFATRSPSKTSPVWTSPRARCSIR